MKQIANYAGLYGEVNARPNADYIFSELIETRSRVFNWVIQPHVHTQLFQLFFIESGQVLFKEAAQEHTVHGACVLFIPPSHLHGLTYSADVTGRILTVSDVLVETLFPTSSAIALALSKIQRIVLFDNTLYSFDWIMRLIVQIDEELFSDRPEKQLMLQTYLNQLFIALYRLLKQDEEAQHRSLENVTLKHFNQFQKSIKRLEYGKGVPDYARELGITPVHLNRVCHAVVGKSALQVIQEHLAHEAKKYLIYTAYSVSEIAYLLEFEYPNYFAKFFKKQTGLSPTAFREQKERN